MKEVISEFWSGFWFGCFCLVILRLVVMGLTVDIYNILH